MTTADDLQRRREYNQELARKSQEAQAKRELEEFSKPNTAPFGFIEPKQEQQINFVQRARQPIQLRQDIPPQQFRQRVNFLQQLNPAPALSKEQEMLQEFFSGESFWGLPEDNLPKINGILRTGSGLIKCEDEFGETRSFFGFGTKSRTGNFFGLY